MNETPSETLPSLAALQANIERVFIGKTDVVKLSLTAFLAGGHLLVEDVPGVGKTTLALAIAKSVGCTFQRIQFTSDLLPSDLLGVSILNGQTQRFDFHPGPLFHQIILADELNRGTPRTQSALLEAMNERQITLDQVTHPLPEPFFVIGTQNPTEHHGTFALPESQLDRFMIRLSIGYPDTEHEKTILAANANLDHLRQIQSVLTSMELLEWRRRVTAVRVAPTVDDYLLSIVQATRTSDRLEVGVSPRGALALRKAAQAWALLDGRDYATPDDVKRLSVPVLAHRIQFSSDEWSASRVPAERLIKELLDTVAVPV